MHLGQKQSGSAAFAALAAIASIVLVGIFVQESSLKTQLVIERSKAARIVEEKNTGAMSALSHYKSLITPKKQGSLYKPALFAENYYDKMWTLRQGRGMSGRYTQNSATLTTINLREPSLFDKDVSRVMEAKAPPKMEDFTVKFIVPNFDSTEKLVQSVDIEVSGRVKAGTGKTESIKIMGRVPLPPPVPYDAKLFYRKPGSGAWIEMKQNADLTEGPYEFVAAASGIAFDVEFE